MPDALAHELRKQPQDHDLSALIPMLVPRSFSDTGHWPGPIHRLQADDFDQTWGVLGIEDALTYVSRPIQTLWDSHGLDWRRIADDNLRRIVEAEPYTHAMVREDGSPFAVAMTYGQNLAGARLLVPGLFTGLFPEGYRVAVPDMTCALAMAANLTREESTQIEAMLAELFAVAAEPVSQKHYAPEPFWAQASGDLGLQWTAPT